MKQKHRTFFMHKWKGLAAGYDESQKMLRLAWHGMPLATSLRQIRKEQAISQETRGRESEHDRYGYTRVRVPEPAP